MRYHADELYYEKVKISGVEAFYTSERVQRDSVPENLYQYEIRQDDECTGEVTQIARGIWVNYFGTLLCKEKLEEVETHGTMYISDGDLRWMPDRSRTLEEWLRKEKKEHI